MNFQDISQQDNIKLHNLFRKQIEEIKNEINQQLSIILNDQQLFKIITSFFLNFTDMSRNQGLHTFLEVYDNGKHDQQYILIIENTIQQNNFISHIMNEKDNEDKVNYFINTINMLTSTVEQKKDYKFNQLSNALFYEGFQNIGSNYLDYKLQYYHRRCRILSRYTRNFSRYQQYKTQQKTQWIFDRQNILQIYFRLKNKKVLDKKEQIIVSIYNNYISSGNISVDQKYKYYQIIKYISRMSIYLFDQIFYINSQEDIKQFINVIQQTNANTINDLVFISNIMKCNEQNCITINFSEELQLDNITDSIIHKMLENIKNKLLKICGLNGNEQFIIVHRVRDKKVFKSMINSDNFLNINEILQQYHDGNLYDVILQSDYQYKNLSGIRIRYLNYIGNDSQLILNHPEDLISLTIESVNLINIKQCINIVNLYSKYNIYKEGTGHVFKKLRMICSIYDKYQNNNGNLLGELVQQNKLEYIHFYVQGQDSKIISQMNVSVNISNLRYFYIYSDYQVDIKVDTSYEFPKYLCCHYSFTGGNSYTMVYPLSKSDAIKNILIQ